MLTFSKMRVARIGRELDLLDPTTIGHTVNKGHTTATSLILNPRHDTSLEDTEKWPRGSNQRENGWKTSVSHHLGSHLSSLVFGTNI